MAVKCPSCNLMFRTRNELDWHVREEHTRSRLPARTPPADDGTVPADRATPVTVEAARAGPQVRRPLRINPSPTRPRWRRPDRWPGSVGCSGRPGPAGNPPARASHRTTTSSIEPAQ